MLVNDSVVLYKICVNKNHCEWFLCSINIVGTGPPFTSKIMGGSSLCLFSRGLLISGQEKGKDEEFCPTTWYKV